MIKEAYEAGVQQALYDMGLTKQANWFTAMSPLKQYALTGGIGAGLGAGAGALASDEHPLMGAGLGALAGAGLGAGGNLLARAHMAGKLGKGFHGAYQQTEAGKGLESFLRQAGEPVGGPVAPKLKRRQARLSGD